MVLMASKINGKLFPVIIFNYFTIISCNYFQLFTIALKYLVGFLPSNINLNNLQIN